MEKFMNTTRSVLTIFCDIPDNVRQFQLFIGIDPITFRFFEELPYPKRIYPE